MNEAKEREVGVRDMLERAFSRGVTMFLVLDALEMLEKVETGIPPSAVEKWVKDGGGQAFPLLLEPEVFEPMNVVFMDDFVEMTLSFDKLYRCSIPYSLVLALNLVFRPKMQVPAPAAEVAKPRPALRLVEEDEESEEVDN